MTTLRIETASVFEPLLQPARQKAAFGGRGSGKSHFFAELLVEDALRFPSEAGEGLRGICAREIQKSLKDSAKFLIESKLVKLGLGEADGFKVYTDKIQTPRDGVLVFQGMQDHTSDSIKSFEGFHLFPPNLWKVLTDIKNKSSASGPRIDAMESGFRYQHINQWVILQRKTTYERKKKRFHPCGDKK